MKEGVLTGLINPKTGGLIRVKTDTFMTQIMRLAPLLLRFAPFLAKYLGPALRPGGIGVDQEIQAAQIVLRG